MDFDIEKAEAIIFQGAERTYQQGNRPLLDGEYPVQIVVNKNAQPVTITSFFCGMLLFFDVKGCSQKHFLSL